jgi:hypothetical protein
MYNLKTCVLLLIALCGLSSFAFARKKKKVPPADWRFTPLLVDGNDSDWVLPLRYNDSKSSLSYSVSNDASNLFIIVKTGDEMMAAKILKGGLTVAIDLNASRNEGTSIQYPLPDLRQQPMQAGAGQRPELSELRTEAMRNAREIVFSGFEGCKGGMLVSKENGCGILVRMGESDYRELVWEARIPLQSFFKRMLQPSDTAQVVGLGFLIGALPKPEMPAGQMPPAGMSGGMPGGMSGGMPGPGGMGGGMPPGGGMGMPGGPMGGSSEAMQKMFETTRLWVNFRFAYQGP